MQMREITRQKEEELTNFLSGIKLMKDPFKINKK